MDSTSLIMGLVLLVIIVVPIVLLARAGKNKNTDELENK